MRFLPLPLVIAALLAPSTARALFHLWDITEVYSNADGTVQFIELATTSNGQDELTGHTLQSDLVTYTFPTDLDPDALGNGNDATANRRMLVATPAFASQPGAVTPDFVLDGPAFFDFVQDSVDFASVNAFAWTSDALPTNGIDSLHEPFGSNTRTVATNSPTNFAGEVGELPEPSGLAALLAGGAAALGLARRREKASVRRQQLAPSTPDC
ncbi:MAG TPA: PEP-CTERM sorting domain-containing protein [Myxococcota bacterium]|nr:PEP-CTERM sorting domain-containing protein [Myxococcota bacterium]